MEPKIDFEDAVLRDVQMPRTSKIYKTVVVIEAPLTPEAASHLGLSFLFRENGDPVPKPGKYAPPITLADVELSLPSGTGHGHDTYRPEVIRGFQVFPKNDLELMVRFRAHITGVDRSYELHSTRVTFLNQSFNCAIRSLQQQFDLDGKGGSGDAVDMSVGRKEEQGPLFSGAACIHCDRGVPRNSDGKHILADSLAECPNPNPEAEASDGPAIPAVHVTGSGRGPKQRSRRNFDPTAVEQPEQEPAFPVN